MFLINKNQIKLTTNLLTNKHINIQFLNNKLIHLPLFQSVRLSQKLSQG